MFQCPASGLNERGAHEYLWYERTFSDIRGDNDTNALILRFGAVDYESWIWVNGEVAGHHIGGHTSFDLDITKLVQTGENRLTIRVRDSPFDQEQPRGKQHWHPEPDNIWYTPSSGIWQNVWLESCS